MSNKQEIMINLLKLVPAIIGGVSGAVELYNKLMLALDDGISEAEWAVALQERDNVIDRLIEKTAPGSDSQPVG